MYTERIVLFIDILGFKELVTDKSNGFDNVNNIYEEFNMMIKESHNRFSEQTRSFERVTNKKYGNVQGIIQFDQKYQDLIFFSDCVVWTYPTDKLPKIDFYLVLFSLCGVLGILTAVLYAKKITFRGGIAIGDIYMSGGKVFGDGLVKAYELEKKACYPRIVFDKKLVEDRVDSRIFKCLFKRKLIYSLKEEHYYFNYFESISMFAEVLGTSKDEKEKKITMLSLSTFVNPVITAINSGICHEKESVRRKYQWLKAKLLSIEKIEPYLKDLE